MSTLKDFKLTMTSYYSSEMIRRLFKIVRREGLPEDFMALRCDECEYCVDKISSIGFVKCFIVLCPYIGKGYIKKRRELKW